MGKIFNKTPAAALAILAVLVALAPLAVADAQVALPPVRVPQLPGIGLPDVGRTVSGATQAIEGQLRGQELPQIRLLRVRELLRTHRDLVEADPRGEPIVRAELLTFSPSDTALERARSAGFTVARERVLEGLEERIVVLQAPPGLSTRRALQRLKKLDPAGSYDFNHLYMESGESVGTAQSVGTASSARAAEAVGTTKGAGAARESWRNSQSAQSRIGLIDGGVEAAHPVFRGRVIHQHGCDDKPAPTAHGTAVASLLGGAELYAADVYCGSPAGGAVDTVADAFGWFSREKIPVINVSLVGPPNVLLERVIQLMTARGYLIVAAVGNDGPNSPPLYPAAYPGVVGVTGVDANRRVLPEAVRGKQVMFAAPGAGLKAAASGKQFAEVRGTSFAAPIVAGLLAAELSAASNRSLASVADAGSPVIAVAPDKGAADRGVANLAARAVDLGAKGRDAAYGYGLVGEEFLKPVE